MQLFFKNIYLNCILLKYAKLIIYVEQTTVVLAYVLYIQNIVVRCRLYYVFRLNTQFLFFSILTYLYRKTAPFHVFAFAY